jgi:hypothetical protein
MVKNESSLVFATQSLDTFEVGEEFTEWLEVTGGTPSYSFAVTGGTLPPGIEVTPLGTVDGVPSEAGSFKFAVEATDSNGNMADHIFNVEVAPQPAPEE